VRNILAYVEKIFYNYSKIKMIANKSSTSTSGNDFCPTCTTDDKKWAYYFGRLGLHI